VASVLSQSTLLNSQEASNCLWAVTTLRLCDESVLPLVEAAARTSATFAPQEAANCLRAVAYIQLGETSDILRLIEATVRLCASFTPQHGANALWALAVLEYSNQEAIQAIARRLPTQVNVEEAQQVIQCHEYFASLPEPIEIADPMRIAAFRAILAENAANTIPSITISTGQRDVAKALARFGFHCQLEVPVLEGLVTIDIMVANPATGQTFALEYDGPTHYLPSSTGPTSSPFTSPFASASTSASPAPSILYTNTGSTVLRNNLIRRAAKLTLLIRPFYEWDQVMRMKSQEAQDEYILKCLQTVACTPTL
jgi:hypothetical protein